MQALFTLKVNPVVSLCSVLLFCVLTWYFFLREEKRRAVRIGKSAACLLLGAAIFAAMYLIQTLLSRLPIDPAAMENRVGIFLFISLFITAQFVPIFVAVPVYCRLIGMSAGLAAYILLEFMLMNAVGMLYQLPATVHILVNAAIMLAFAVLLHDQCNMMKRYDAEMRYGLFDFAVFALSALSYGLLICKLTVAAETDMRFVSVILDVFGLMVLAANVIFSKMFFNSTARYFEAVKAAEEREKLMRQLTAAQENTILSFAEIVEAKSGQTGKHVKRVSEYSLALARQLGLPEEEAQTVRIASMMHDVGKLMIPNEILEKPGKLTDDEFNTMKQHVRYGEDLLKTADGDILQAAKLIAAYHHTRWDGRGYLAPLREDEIPLCAQIVSLADVFDALTSVRSYKSAWTPEAARDEIIKQRGAQFSPRCVDAFEVCFPEFLSIAGQYRDNGDEHDMKEGQI